MELQSIIEYAENGNLILEKHARGKRTRQLPIYSKEKGETICGQFFGDIIGYKKIEYTPHIYLARTGGMDKNSFWKITKNDFNLLNKILTKQKGDLQKTSYA